MRPYQTLTSVRRGQLVWGLTLWLALLVTVWLYWPGLKGSPILDDGVNLRSIYSLEESAAYLGDVVEGNRSGPLGRPISMLSFALEHVYLQRGLWGVKFNNLMLHLLCGCLVAWLGVRLIPRFCGVQCRREIGVLVALPWLLTPFFVSTVLYMVQRMSQLATLFCLAGLLFYVVGRDWLENGREKGWLLCAAIFPCAALALFSKENGAVLLPLVMLVEAVAWQWKIAANQSATHKLRGLHLFIVVGGLAATISYVWLADRNLVNGFQHRDFSLEQRLLTQARVLFEYAGHLFMPLRDGLGVFHDDYEISRSLTRPWSTLPAVLAMMVVLATTSLRVWFRRCVISFGILFYLGAHVVESTVIPLELYFEHRNYLPAFGLYLAVIVSALQATSRYSWLRPPLMLAFIMWLLLAILNTGIQASLWGNEMVVLMDSERSHPRSVRVASNIAGVFARMGEREAMIRYADKAESMNQPGHLRHVARKLVLMCIANEAVPARSLEALDARIAAEGIRDPGFNESLQVFVENVNRGKCPILEAAPVAAIFRSYIFSGDGLEAPPRVYGLLGILEQHLGNYAVADQYMLLWLKREPDAVQAWMIRLYLATAMNQPELKAEAREELDRLDRRGMLSREQRDDVRLFR